MGYNNNQRRAIAEGRCVDCLVSDALPNLRRCDECRKELNERAKHNWKRATNNKNRKKKARKPKTAEIVGSGAPVCEAVPPVVAVLEGSRVDVPASDKG